MAVFTLPQDIIPFYKEKIEYISDHAVDPDKRRYASSFEAIRHYIDIDHWGKPPFDNIPRDWYTALSKTSVAYAYSPTDTFEIYAQDLMSKGKDTVQIKMPLKSGIKIFNLPFRKLRLYFVDKIIPQYYEESWNSERSTFCQMLKIDTTELKDFKIVWKDRLSEYGVIPWHLQAMQKRLTYAFQDKKVDLILRLSAEMGHYISDAHVPLHTTVNYNGQLTDQLGIHAFWESRIPELFAEEEYDFIVGQAEYIEDPREFYWDIVLESHSLVDSVLIKERRVRNRLQEDEIYCYDERLNSVVRTQCKEFAKAYSLEMNGMVEKRMRETIKAIGSSWYTAWVDAGQPSFNIMSDSTLVVDENTPLPIPESKKFKTRKHE